jgi:hypothetical protein
MAVEEEVGGRDDGERAEQEHGVAAPPGVGDSESHLRSS